MKSIISQAAKIVTPSKELKNKKLEIGNMVLELVNKEIAKYPEIEKAELGGSYQKNTWLPKDADIDIFIQFVKSTSNKKFTEITHKVGFTALKKFKPYTRYSEHPYVEAQVKGTKINIVPCFIVSQGQWKSAADRSVFHAKFMNKELTDPMKRDVRLLKQFLKNNGIYGAEISKQGFSGYAAETIIYQYKTFENTITTIAKIKPNHVIGKPTKKFDTSIIITDPIDSNRNLAAAISNENIGKFILLCRVFIQKPSISFFKSKKKRINSQILKNCISIKFKYEKRSPDTIWGQIKKAANVLSQQIELGGFKIIKNDAITNEKGEAILLFMVESIQAPPYYVKQGPEFFNESSSTKFIATNQKKAKMLWIKKDKKITAIQERSETNIKQFLEKLLTKGLGRSGIPTGIKPDIKQGFEVHVGITTNKSIKMAMREFVSTDVTIFSTN
jgi:tRNA nucleotidyltransferase (CCA-adding enzyme)